MVCVMLMTCVVCVVLVMFAVSLIGGRYSRSNKKNLNEISGQKSSSSHIDRRYRLGSIARRHHYNPRTHCAALYCTA